MARPYAKSPKEGGPQHEDVFVEKILQAGTWAQENLTTVIVAVTILALGVAGILYYRSYQASVREQAAVDLQNLAATLGTQETASATDTLRSFVERYRGAPAADEARVLLGRVHLDAGRPAEAIQVLRPSAERGADTPIGYAARMLIAAAHEQQGERDPALRLYAELGASARLPFQRRHALADRARLLAEEGRFEEAAAIYEDLARRAEEAEAPDEAAEYRLRHGETSALAAASGSAPQDASGSEPTGSRTSEGG